MNERAEMKSVEIHIQGGDVIKTRISESQERVLRNHIGSGNRPYVIQDENGNDIVLNLNAVTLVEYCCD